jgi:DNA-binding transcriptional ArsR family regulator
MTKTTSRPKIVEKLAETFDSKFFKSLSEPVRIQIMKYLILHGRSDIATIASHLPQDRSVISRHLNFMQEVGILRSVKETRHVFYEINCDGFLSRLQNVTGQLKECINECIPKGKSKCC